MPVREYLCPRCQTIGEEWRRHMDDPPTPCPDCGGEREELASRFGIVFTGQITAKYNDPKREAAHREGFWTYRKKTSISGQPEPVKIETWDQLRAFNKAEGLAAPGEVPTNSTVSADGRRIESRGMPGQWTCGFPSIPSRLQDIIDMPAEKFRPVGASVTPRMPMNYGIKAEPVEATVEVGKT